MFRLRLVLLGVLVVGAVSAFASASASALEFFVNNALLQGLLSIESKGGVQKLNWKIAGVAATIECELENNGSIHNGLGPGGMLMGLGLVLLLFLNCKVVGGATFKKCVVGNGKTIHFNVFALTITKNGITLLELKPDPATSTVFVNIVLSQCEKANINGEYPLEGAAYHEVENSTGEVFATVTTFTELTIAGLPATYEGRDKWYMAGNEAEKIEVQ